MKGPFVCKNCGEEWPEHPFSLVECPKCGAGAGQYCKRPSGHQGPIVEYHVEREALALERGVITQCKARTRTEPESPKPSLTLF